MTARHLAAAALCAGTLAALPLSAQQLPPGTVTSSVALTGLAQFNTDLDAGGRFGWSAMLAAGSVYRQFTPQLGAGFAVQYDYQRWRFSQPAAFGGVAPWDDLNLPQVGATLVYAIDPAWRVTVSPSVAWSYAGGASTHDAVNYGAVAIASRTFSPTLTLGLGAAVYRQLDRTRAFPFLAVDWKIDDRWRLANPFPAGPAGGAGLELVYQASDAWQIGMGGTYRSYEFRLAEDGAAPNGIGEHSLIPVFLRLTYNIGAQGQVDLYAAGLANGNLKVKNQDGSTLASDDYRVAPAVALTFRYRF